MERDNENSDEKTLVPIVPADNDVFSPEFLFFAASGFQINGGGNRESIPAEIDNDAGA